MATSDSHPEFGVYVPNVTLRLALAAQVPSFVPMIAEDFSSGTSGSRVVTSGSSWDTKSTYDQTHAVSGGQAMKVSILSETVGDCVGDHFYGGFVALPKAVPKGKTIWTRYKMYIPSTFSWGYVYSGANPSPGACGLQSDGFGRHKFLVFDSDDSSGKLYLQPHGSYRSVSRAAGLTIDTDVGGFGAIDSEYLVPVDQWFDLQIEIYLDDVNGFYRVWSDGVYKGQVDGPTLGNATAKISKVGIGNYWNGAHYTDGQAGRSDFWVDEMIVASDVDGYGAPAGQDAGGRPFINPATLVSSLV